MATGRYEDHDGVLVGPGCPLTIASTVSLRRPVQLAARQSGIRSTGVNDNVARDAYEAANALFEKLDIYVLHLLPSYEEIADLITKSTNLVEAHELATGQPFKCVFARLDLRHLGQALVVTLTAGSAAKLDSHRQSPVIINLADDMAAWTPSVLCGKRSDRIRRQGWAQAVMWAELDLQAERGQPIAVVDGETGLWRDDDFAQAQHLVDGKKDRKHALSLFKTTRNTMLSKMARAANTETGAILMVDDNIPFALPSAPPPGLTRIEILNEPVSGVTKRLYLDSPACYPAQGAAKTPLPIVLDAHGEPADQIANIRWYLKHAGNPAWGVHELGREMVKRGYSTEAIRWNTGPAGKYDDHHAYALQEALWTNLDLYETGTFHRRLLDQTVTFEGIWPPDGKPWADEADFSRIRRWRATETQRYSRQAGNTFASLPLTYNGEPRRLTAAADELGSTSVKYRFARSRDPHEADRAEVGVVDTTRTLPSRTPDLETQPTDAKRPAPLTAWLEHDWIADAILQALRRAQQAPSPRVTLDEADSQLHHLRTTAQNEAQKLKEAQLDISRIEHDVNERLPEPPFEHVMPAHVRKAKWDRHTELNDSLPALQQAAADAERDIEVHRARLAEIRRGLDVAAIADVLVSLLDPHDVTYRGLWRETIQNLQVTATHQHLFALSGRLVEFSFELHISKGPITIAAPASGRQMLGRLGTAEDLARDLLEDLRAGMVLAPNEMGLRRSTAQLLRNWLNCPDGRAVFLQCREPALLRLGMSVLFPRIAGSGFGGTDVSRVVVDEKTVAALMANEEFVALFTRPDVLAARIMGVYSSLKPQYRHFLHPVGPVHAQGLTAARRRAGRLSASDLDPRRFGELKRSLARGPWDREWEHDGDDLVLRACPSCGSTNRAALVLREVDGYVCLDCRADSSGVTWPTPAFDAYTVDDDGLAATWVEVRRPPLAGPASKTGRPGNSGSSPTGSVDHVRGLPELSEDQIDALVRAYVEDRSSMRLLAGRYGLHRRDVSRLLHSRGVVTRSGRSPRGFVDPLAQDG